MSEDIRFGLLGSLEVTAGGCPVVLSSRRVRALLALLVLRANQVVGTNRVIAGLWGQEPPKAARESVHYFVHQLRKLLPHSEGDRQGMLERHGGGYLLRIDPECIDATRFQRGVEEAAAARDRGEWQAAWEHCSQALALWRGPALDDLADVPFAAAEITRLTELRLEALEHQFSAGLELGWHDRLVSELDAQVHANPVREELRRLLMLALYRSGRQAEALRAYQDARAHLAGRGEPGARLRELQRAILTQDPTLDFQPLNPLRQRTPSGLAGELTRPTHSVPPAAAAPAPPPPGGSSPQLPRSAAPRRHRVPGVEGRADERKLVTALVVGIVADPDQRAGDPEEVRARTGETMARAAARIWHYGGMVQTTEIGRLLAVFGADRSHDDDPERAVRAALEIVAPADAHEAPGLAVRAGVATGEAVVTRGEDDAGQVVGDVVHVAVTLEQNARAGVVVVNAATHQATSQGFRYTQMAPSGSLERSSGMRLWQALEPRGRTGAQAQQRPDAPLVERERELRFLNDILARFLRDREPQFLTLVSEPGLGKSRLVAELARLVDQASELVGWRVGHARAYGQGALGALVEVVKAEAGVLDDDDGPTILRRLEETVGGLFGEQGTQIVASLGKLLGIGGEALPSQPQALFDDWAEFFAAVAEQRPLVMVLEDLQWADDALVEFVGELAARVGPVPLLLVVTGRPEFPERAGWGGGQRNVLTLALAPLSHQGTTVLLDALLEDAAAEQPVLGKERLPEQTRKALLDAAGGNPLYVEEYVHMLAGQDAAPAEQPLPMPPSVQQVIAARIDALPPEDKRLLQDAAVIGETCFLGQLVAVTGGGSDEVAGLLRQLERQGYLLRRRVPSVAGETEYAFRHALIREVAYGQLLRADRTELHERAAAWIQRQISEPHDRTELLAYHYRRAYELASAAGQPAEELAERARNTLRVAADHAAAVGAFAAAAGYYTDALNLWPETDPDRPQVLVRLGEVRIYLELAGEQPLLQAREAFLAAGDTVQAAEVERQLGIRARTVGRIAEAGQHLQHAAELAAGSLPVRSGALAHLALEKSIVEDHAEALRIAREVLDSSSGHDLPSVRGAALSAIGQSRIYLGDLDGGAADYRQALELLEHANDPWAGFSRWGLALAYWQYGDLAAARATIAECRARTDPTHAVALWLGALEACLAYQDGDWEPVVAFVDQLLARPASTPTRLPEPWPRPLRGRIRLARGDLAGARTDADATFELADVLGEPRLHHTALALLGHIDLVAGDHDAAAERLDELLAAQRTAQAPTVTLDQAMLLVGLDQPADALPDAPPTAWNLAAKAFARRSYAEAADRYTRIGARVPEAVTRLRVAGAHAAAGAVEQARLELERCLPVLERTGTGAALAEALALRSRLSPDA